MCHVLTLSILALVAAAPALASEQVAVPSFQYVELRGGGEVLVRHAPVQRITLMSGSAQVSGFRVTRDRKLEIDACRSRCPRGYRLKVLIETPAIDALAVKGGGTLTALALPAGQRELATAVQGGGRIDARAVSAINVAASVQGGGEILVRARDNLAAAVMGGGSVRYLGNPKVSAVTQGGGSVRRID